MSRFDPFDADRPLMLKCGCGRDHSPAQHDAESAAASEESFSRDFIEATLVKALLPSEPLRRRFLQAVGATTARAAIASLLPMGALEALAQDKGPLEKKDLKIGFIAITCATPLIMADPLGFYKKEGLNVQLNKTAGWALIRDKMLNKEHDASHFLSPMPLAISMGLGSVAQPMRVATVQNINGQAITLALKHKDNRDPKYWKGFKFAIPFEYSMHNFLLRYYLAEAGLNPDTDVQLRVVPPPEMVANLRAGNIDGFLGPDPFNRSRRNKPRSTSPARSRSVAATSRTSIFTSRLPPSRTMLPSCSVRSSLACICSGSSPISSRKIVPRSACSNQPARAATAPVNAPRSWPNSSDSNSVSGMAAQLTLMKGASRRLLARCTARANNSLPVPDSPSSSTLADACDTRSSSPSACNKAGEVPMIP